MIMLVSSAKSTGFAEVAMVFGRSLMYSKYNSGPRIYNVNLANSCFIYIYTDFLRIS